MPIRVQVAQSQRGDLLHHALGVLVHLHSHLDDLVRDKEQARRGPERFRHTCIYIVYTTIYSNVAIVIIISVSLTYHGDLHIYTSYS